MDVGKKIWWEAWKGMVEMLQDEVQLIGSQEYFHRHCQEKNKLEHWAQQLFLQLYCLNNYLFKFSLPISLLPVYSTCSDIFVCIYCIYYTTSHLMNLHGAIYLKCFHLEYIL
jgi:hypothetical protein